MDNEKKYNELVGKIKRAYLYAQTNSTKAVLEDILPELAESKDEKIRKAIYGWINTRPSLFFDGGFSKEEMLAWLEKQGEQILANSAKTGKDEPKFHEGEWIISNDKKSTYQVIEVKRGIYVIRDNVDNHEYYIGIETCERSGRLWTIEDAKDGDVLYSSYGQLLWIYKDGISCYVGQNLSYSENCVVVNSPICIPSDVCPATKEQRDLLFQKIEEAGYMWDAEKKEPKKIEQKLTNSYCQEHCKGFQETGKCFADGDCKAKTIAETVHAGTENILNELADRIEKAEIVNVRQVLEWIEEQTSNTKINGH